MGKCLEWGVVEGGVVLAVPEETRDDLVGVVQTDERHVARDVAECLPALRDSRGVALEDVAELIHLIRDQPKRQAVTPSKRPGIQNAMPSREGMTRSYETPWTRHSFLTSAARGGGHLCSRYRMSRRRRKGSAGERRRRAEDARRCR